ncbi:MAG TPA: polymer-forming cytoskeletal protein [Blastocatellia bacterium]
MKLVKGDNPNSDFGWIGRGIEVTGDIVFTDRIQVDGKVTGRLASESGTLVVGESGHLQAEVDVGICVVHGSVHGNLIARSKVEIRKSGRINGDVITPVLLVEEGAVFNGAIKMGQEATSRNLERILADGIDNDAQMQAKGA